MSSEDWLEDPFVKEWLSKVGERTQRNYKQRFPKWLAFIDMTPTEQFNKRVKDLQSSNPKERGYFEDQVIAFKNQLIAQDYTPATIHCIIVPVQSFFSAHRVPLRFKRGELKVETRTVDKVVREWIPDNQQAKQIYQHGSIRDRALFLCLYQSGFSETDVSSLNVEDLPDIEKTEGHYYIAMHREKTDILQRTCISEECVHDLKEYLIERRSSNQLIPEKKTGKIPLFTSQKGYRLTVRYININIKDMVEKTYGEEKAKEFKTKSLRDAYNDALLRANLTQEVKDTLFGHKRGGAREKYAISQATVIDAYNKAFQFLTVNHGTQARKDIEEMNEKIRSMQSDQAQLLSMIKSMNGKIETLNQENFNLKTDMDTVKREIGSNKIKKILKKQENYPTEVPEEYRDHEDKPKENEGDIESIGGIPPDVLKKEKDQQQR